MKKSVPQNAGARSGTGIERGKKAAFAAEISLRRAENGPESIARIGPGPPTGPRRKKEEEKKKGQRSGKITKF